MHSIAIEFPTEELKKRFKGYMSDGGGEYGFMESREESLVFNYNGDTIKVEVHDVQNDDNGRCRELYALQDD